MARVKFSTLATGLVLGLVVAASPSVSRADTTSFTLTTGNAALAGFPGPYGTVLVNRTDTTHATITFTAFSGFMFGGQGAADVNVNASTWTLGTVTGTNAGIGFTPGPYSNGGSGNVSTFGVFNQT